MAVQQFKLELRKTKAFLEGDMNEFHDIGFAFFVIAEYIDPEDIVASKGKFRAFNTHACDCLSYFCATCADTTVFVSQMLRRESEWTIPCKYLQCPRPAQVIRSNDDFARVSQCQCAMHLTCVEALFTKSETMICCGMVVRIADFSRNPSKPSNYFEVLTHNHFIIFKRLSWHETLHNVLFLNTGMQVQGRLRK